MIIENFEDVQDPKYAKGKFVFGNYLARKNDP